MRNLMRIVAAVVVLIFSFTVIGCSSKTVAEVNGEKITKSQLDKRVKKIKMALESQGAFGKDSSEMLKVLEQQTLDDMITQSLILQAAKKEGVYPAKSEVDKQLEEIKVRFGGESKFNEELKKYQLESQDIVDNMYYESAYSALYEKITANVKVTDDDIKKWYDNNKASYKEPTKIKARSILIKFDDPTQPPSAMGQPAEKVNRTENDAKKTAEDIIKQLNSGKDFAVLAKEKSEDESSKNDGGLIKDPQGSSPYAKGALMPAEFDQAALALKPGKITTAPVKTSGGFYVIKLESVTPEKQLSFEEAKEKIRQDLPIRQKQDKFTQYMSDLRNSAKVVNKLEQEAPQTPAGMPQGTPPASSK